MTDLAATAVPPSVPSGVVTLVFTDIQDSSVYWETYREAFEKVLNEHNRLMRETAARWRGYEVGTEGDAFFIVFARASEAVRFSVEAQQSFARCDWTALLPGLSELRVRMGMHTGEPIITREGNGWNFYGPATNRAARVSSAGHGAQILVSEATRSLAAPELPPEITFLDLGEHRLKGVGEEHVWQVCHPELERVFVPLKTLNPERHNLPPQSTPFIGREKELAQWLELLRQPALRLLTLTAFGGHGKTRTALQLAELCADDFKDGVWFAELEASRTGEAMVQRIAYHLRLHLQPQPSVREQLWAYLRERELLLVLDNTEQNPEAGKVIKELLDAAPCVKCLVTSRRRLDLRAERVVEVPPLPPEDAEALFVERARACRGDFELSEENAADVRELCRGLEYVPLAIELAASRSVAMTPREILSRLTQRFNLLKTRSPDLPDRQRALRGTIDWSYDLLQEEDRLLFAQLAVFAGGFTMADAEAVCDAFDVFESVVELRRQSLLRSEEDSETQETRYLLLEAVREYAAERLKEFPDEGREARERHAAHFLAYGEKRAALMRTRNELKALNELSSEFDNLRAALVWTHEEGRAEPCGRLALVLYQLLYRRGFWAEAAARLGKALELVRPEEAPALCAALSRGRASLAHDMDDVDTGEALAEASLELSRKANDIPGTAEALNLLGLIRADRAHRAASQWNEDEARAHAAAARAFYEEALALLPRGEDNRRGMVLNNLALLDQESDREAARRRFEEALAHRRAAGDARGQADTVNNLGAIAYFSGDYAEAKRRYDESLALHRTLGDRHGIAVSLNNLAELAELEGGAERAAALYLHAARIFRELESASGAYTRQQLEALQAKLEPARWAEIQERARHTRWEDLI